VTTKRAKKPSGRGIDLDGVRALFAKLDGVEEGTSYGTVAWKAKKKLVARVKEDGATLVVRAPFELRDALMESDPETFFITDHYQNYPAVLVRMAKVGRTELAALFLAGREFVTSSSKRSRRVAPPSRRTH
jgi:hypothetical protein